MLFKRLLIIICNVITKKRSFTISFLRNQVHYIKVIFYMKSQNGKTVHANIMGNKS